MICAAPAQRRHRVSKQLLRHGRIYRDGKSQWTKMHRAWIARQRLDNDLAHAALAQTLLHLDGLDRQLDALDRDLEQIARGERWAATIEILTRFKGVSTRTALGLIAEIGDFTRFGLPRELCAWLGIVPSECSSGQQRHRGHITKTEADAFVARFPGPRSGDCPGGLRRRLGSVRPWGSAGLRGPAPSLGEAELLQAGARVTPGR